MVPAGSVSGEVAIVVPLDDVVEALPPVPVAAVAALVIAVRLLGNRSDPVGPSDALPDSDAPLFDVVGELVGGGTDTIGALCGNSNEIPVLPSTDPV